MNALGLICARGGSKGLPGKNTRMLAGRPLIGWAVAHARAVPRISRVIVSTDSQDIADAAVQAGAERPFVRPASLAEDTSPEWLVWQHALNFMFDQDGKHPDALVVVPCTAPLRHPIDIERCLDEFEKGGADIVIAVTEAHRNPWFNMVKDCGNGRVDLVIRPEGRIARRQDVPKVYDITTVAYVASPEFVLNSGGIFDGTVRCVHVPQERSIDIDTLLDFRIAECIKSFLET
jgi:CMP-N-acetylneuraminic acid synthetase